MLDSIIAGTPDDAVAPQPVAVTRSMSAAARALPWPLAAALAVVAVLLWAPWRSESPADRPLMRLDVDLGADAAFPLHRQWLREHHCDLARRYAIGLPLRHAATTVPTSSGSVEGDRASGNAGSRPAFFSSDGRWVGFVTDVGINRISGDGGAVVPLGEVTFAGASWADEGSIVVADFRKGLLRFPVAGGTPAVVAPPKGEALAHPHLLPGGTATLLVSCASADVDNCNVEVLTLVDG